MHSSLAVFSIAAPHLPHQNGKEQTDRRHNKANYKVGKCIKIYIPLMESVQYGSENERRDCLACP